MVMSFKHAEDKFWEARHEYNFVIVFYWMCKTHIVLHSEPSALLIVQWFSKKLTIWGLFPKSLKTEHNDSRTKHTLDQNVNRLFKTS